MSPLLKHEDKVTGLLRDKATGYEPELLSQSKIKHYTFYFEH